MILPNWLALQTVQFVAECVCLMCVCTMCVGRALAGRNVRSQGGQGRNVRREERAANASSRAISTGGRTSPRREAHVREGTYASAWMDSTQRITTAVTWDRGHVGPQSRGTAVTHHDRGHVGRVSPRAQSVMCVATRTRDRERERERETPPPPPPPPPLDAQIHQHGMKPFTVRLALEAQVKFTPGGPGPVFTARVNA